MKNKTIGMMLASLVIVMLGSVGLMLSITQIKATVQGDVGEGVTIGTEVASNIVNTEDFSYSTKQDEKIVFYDHRIDEGDVQNQLAGAAMTKVEFVYQGQEVTITDALLGKNDVLKNATVIMDYLFNYVDEILLTPYEIEKTNFSYDIQRQYRFGEDVYYAVFFKCNDMIQCSLGISLEERPVLRSFTRDAFVDLRNRSNTPEKFLVENWCRSTTEREEVYAEYIDLSQKIIVDVLGMPEILLDVKNIDCASYFCVEDIWSMVTFGYVLEDGTYIKMIYNRVNQMWDGFVVDGYHQDYVK